MAIRTVNPTVIATSTRVLSRKGDKMQIVFATGRGDETINLERRYGTKWLGDDGWFWPFPTHPGVPATPAPQKQAA